MQTQFVTKDEIKQSVLSANPNLVGPELDRQIDGISETMYGSEKKYRERLEAYEEEKANQFDSSIDEDYYQKLKTELEPNEFANPAAADEFERQRIVFISQGLSETVADLRSRQAVELKFGETAYSGPENDPMDKHVAKLENAGFYLTDPQKIRIKALMRTKGLTALDAMREVGIEEGRKKFEEDRYLEKMSDKQREYFDLLTAEDKRVLAGLQAAMPDAEWTPAKFYKQSYGDKPRKKAPAKPPEPTVSREKYEKEHQRYMKVRQEFIDTFGYDPDDAA